MAKSREKKITRRYSAAKRAKALEELAANNGNISKAAKLIGISHNTLRKWRGENKLSDVAVAIDRQNRNINDEFKTLARQLLDALPTKITAASLSQLTSTLEFTLDKIQSLHEEMLNSETRPIDFSMMSDEELDRLEQLTALLLPKTSNAGVHFLNAQTRAARAMRTVRTLSPLDWNRRFLPHHFTPKSEKLAEATPSDIPELHSWFAEKLRNLHDQRGCRLAVIAPRESAKSTWITLAYVLRCAVENREPYILLLSDSKDQAAKFLAAIKAELEHNADEPCSADGATADRGNPGLASAYPDVCRKGPVWRKESIQLKNGVLIESLGRGSKIRGRKKSQYRPTLIVIDDCQSNRDITSSTERKKTLDWFKQEVIPSGSDSTNFISVGSALHRDAVSVRAQTMPGWVSGTFSAILTWPDRMDLWMDWELQAVNLADADRVKTAAEFYSTNKAEMDRGGISFWPSYKPMSVLMMRRAEIGLQRFLTEYQGIPSSPENAEWPPHYFDRPNLMFTEWPTDIVRTIIALDPSAGRADKKGDYQAHVVISLTRDGKLWVDCECRREPVREMVSRSVELAQLYHPHCLVVETNQGLDLLIPEFERTARELKMVIPLQNVEHFNESKFARIRRLGSYLSREQIRVRNTTGGQMLVDQLRDFPNGDHDDAPDALELGIRRLELLSLGK